MNSFSFQDFPSSLQPLAEKILSEKRLSFDDGVALYHTPYLLALGKLANEVKERKTGNKIYYVLNRHINYTNVCAYTCTFCAFGKKLSDSEAFELSLEEIWKRIEPLKETPIREIHIVGGLHPHLSYSYYLDLIRGIRERLPEADIKAFTAVEIEFFSRLTQKPFEKILEDFQAAGMKSLTGGGAEIFAEKVRRQICPGKASSERWLAIHRYAHSIGLRSTCTMLYGHIESIEDRVDHLLRLRSLQDETHGFTAFIPLKFHPENTALSHLPEPSGIDHLKNIAVSRLLLDNFDHIKSYWVMASLPMTEMAAWFGADDMDGTVLEEHIYHMAGAKTPQAVTDESLRRRIEKAGRDPVERDAVYNPVPRAQASGHE